MGTTKASPRSSLMPTATSAGVSVWLCSAAARLSQEIDWKPQSGILGSTAKCIGFTQTEKWTYASLQTSLRESCPKLRHVKSGSNESALIREQSLHKPTSATQMRAKGVTTTTNGMERARSTWGRNSRKRNEKKTRR